MSVRIVFKQVSLYPKSVRHFSSMRLSPRSFHGKNNGIKSTTPTFHFLRKSLSVSQIKLFSGHGKPPVDTIEEEIHGTKVTFERQDPDDDDNNDAVEVPEIDTSKYTHEVVTKMPDDFEGKIVEWYKEEGDIINRGDIICDVDTAEFVFAMESDDEGITVMGEKLVEINEEAAPKTPMYTILHEEDPNA